VISDLHLGDGIGAPAQRGEQALDRELEAFLHHYSVVRREGRPWRLVINGDMVDFLGVLLREPAAADADQASYELRACSEAAELRMEAVIERHGGVFAALAGFVAAGNEVAVIIGNHDAEFHFPAVQERFRGAILGAMQRSGAPDADAAVARIAFHPWFFFEEGVAWIEHGHQYDPYCSFEDVLEPATDATEIDPNVGSGLVRYVLNHLMVDAHDQYDDGFFGHLRFAGRQGVRGGLGVVAGYRDMCVRLIGHWRERTPERILARMKRSKERMAGLARRFRLRDEQLARVRALWSPPVVQDLGRLLRAVMLDRLFLLVLTPLLLLAPLVTPWEWLPFVGVPLVVGFGAGLRQAMRARETPDPREAMRLVSRRLREMLRVPVVVFGHTHDATEEPGYLNTGTWAAHGSKRAFTHVLIERTKGGVEAKLLQWRDGDSRAWPERA
jgi:UDP-2,3-diacylglucosamine pyrophosphatase LpxH